MACPTCDGTMQNAGTTPGGRTLHLCPRCGTSIDGEGTVYVPAPVDQCRKFEEHSRAEPAMWSALWRASGISECIRRPEDRPQPEGSRIMGKDFAAGPVSCPTCSTDMHQNGCCTVTGRPFHWCPRCGANRDCDGNVTAPALVAFCRRFASEFTGADPSRAVAIVDVVRRLDWSGVTDSINVPADRP